MEHQKISYERRTYESVDVRKLFWVISHWYTESSTPGLKGINTISWEMVKVSLFSQTEMKSVY